MFQYIWFRINKHQHKRQLLNRLNDEIVDGINMCFTGRMTRLINILVGYYQDIKLKISENEQISAIILNFKDKYSNNNDELKGLIEKELIERGINENIINEWLVHI